MAVPKSWIRASALAAAVVLSAAACSDDGSREGTGSQSPAALKTCQDVFGAENVDAVAASLGGGELKAEATSLDQVTDALTSEARTYKPGSEDLSRTSYEPCRLGAAGEGGQVGVTGQVKWSVLTMDSVEAGKPAGKWRRAGDQIYVQSLARTSGVAVVLPCRIPGAVPEQKRELPLEISVLDQGLGNDKDAVLGRLLPAMATDTRDRLGCEDPLSVPPVLSP